MKPKLSTFLRVALERERKVFINQNRFLEAPGESRLWQISLSSARLLSVVGSLVCMAACHIHVYPSAHTIGAMYDFCGKEVKKGSVKGRK